MRVTKKALAPVEPDWLVFTVGPGDLWLGDGGGRGARFEIAWARESLRALRSRAPS